MNRYRSIGVALDGSAVALRGLYLTMWLASHVSARAYVLTAGAVGPGEETLTRLGVPQKYWPLVELRQLEGDAGDAILLAERDLGLDLIVLTARGASLERKAANMEAPIGHVTRHVIQQSAAPVLVLPPNYEEDLPWHSALVPLSGELGPDDALTVALGLAAELDLSVTVAHVAADAAESAELTSGHYVDELHHEYPGRLNELIDRACPLCGPAERERIESFVLCHGDIAEELLAIVGRESSGVIVVGWRGKFIAGHANVLRTLLERVSCPLLLVKALPREPFRLKVGNS
jgi:nucleotide-binding universal stress UspA family protein